MSRPKSLSFRGLISFLLLCVPAAPAMAAEPEGANLVRQLGDDSYQVRQQAVQQLSDLGLKAQDALMAGLKDSDPQVRRQCRWILSDVMEGEFQQRVQAFLADTEDKQPHRIPGWERYPRSDRQRRRRPQAVRRDAQGRAEPDRVAGGRSRGGRRGAHAAPAATHAGDAVARSQGPQDSLAGHHRGAVVRALRSEGRIAEPERGFVLAELHPARGLPEGAHGRAVQARRAETGRPVDAAARRATTTCT